MARMTPTRRRGGKKSQRDRQAARAAVALLTAAGFLAGCGAGKLTADSRCSDYLQRPQQERYDTAIRLSAALHAQDAGSPMWPLNLDYNCAHSPGETLRQAFGK
jgi:hypothetical protein